ncbi:DUF521 domain-containing protein, partial [Candidatus Bathyarchaeota archaeon]|nr:DUF521 domain-containing protein [Candidatus Bathyarchaeota archaeon]
MYLTKEEEKAFNGEYGPLQEWAMKFLTKFGDIYDAEKFIEISSAFTFLPSSRSLEPEIYKALTESKLAVSTYSHNIGDPESWKDTDSALFERLKTSVDM